MTSNCAIQLLNQCQNNPNNCPCKNTCYNPNVSALIFQFPNIPNKKKIMLISESPYNFPGKCRYTGKDANDVNEFIQNHFQRGLDKAAQKYGNPPRNRNICPQHIYEFIYLTFYKIFQNTSNQQNWAREFLDRIYWTHLGKRRSGNQNKNKSIFWRCFDLLSEEIKNFQPHVIIIIQLNLFKKLIPQNIFNFCPTIYDIIRYYTNSSNLIINCNLCNLNLPGSPKNVKVEVIFIPNPSKANNRYKPTFYQQLQPQIQNTFNYIDQII